jgi:hypothetical protein
MLILMTLFDEVRRLHAQLLLGGRGRWKEGWKGQSKRSYHVWPTDVAAKLLSLPLKLFLFLSGLHLTQSAVPE